MTCRIFRSVSRTALPDTVSQSRPYHRVCDTGFVIWLCDTCLIRGLWYVVIWCDIMWYNVIWIYDIPKLWCHDTSWYYVIWCDIGSLICRSSYVMIRHDITWYDVITYGVIWRCDTALHPSTHIWNMSDTRWYRCDMSVIRTAIRSSAHQRRSSWYNVIRIWYALINHDTTRISHDTTGFAPPHHLSFLRAGVSSSSESSGRRQCFTVRPRVLPPLLFFPPEIFSIMWFRLQRGFLLAFGWHFISSWVTSKMCAHMPDLRAPLQLHRNENGLAVHGTHEPVLQAYSAARAHAHCAAATVCLATRCVSRAYHDTYHNIS